MENLTVATKADVALKAARDISIDTDQAMWLAGQMLSNIKALAAEVKRDREDERLAAKATLDAIVAGRNRHLAPLLEAEKIIKQKQIAYEDEQNRKRREEQARLEAEAQAEAERIAEEQALIAAELEEAGDVEQAKAVLETPVEAPAPVVVPDLKPKIQGQHTKVLWKCRLKDIEQVPIGLLQFDPVAANRWVQGIKDELTRRDGERRTTDRSELADIAEMPNGSLLPEKYQQIPGVEIYIEKSRAASGR